MPWNSLSTICGTESPTISEIDSAREFIQIALAHQPASNQDRKLLLAGVGEFHDDGLNDLPGTEKEIRGIKAQADQALFPSEVLFNSQSSKARVREKISNASIAHFSTHGFARGDKSSGNTVQNNPNVDFGLLLLKSSIARNPLTDSGLVMSPTLAPDVLIASSDKVPKTIPPEAWQTATKHTSSEAIQIAYASNLRSAGNLDAIIRSGSDHQAGKKSSTNLLTAEEIVELNLENCKLVSLSACKTGLGTGLDGQGVIGLRSSIIAAGAHSILMSLWSVDDDATQQLMCKFYSYLLNPDHPLSEVESLQKAQEYIRSQHQWQSPIYWAGWVIAGDGWQKIR